MSGFDHIGFGVGDYDASNAFYAAALAPLGLRAVASFPIPGGNITAYGAEAPIFWINSGEAVGGRVHLAFQAGNRAAVDAFHAAGLAAGGTDNGGPGIRTEYSPGYYAAFLLDPDGHNVEAVYHEPA